MLTLVDVERAIANRDPQLGDILCRYLEQSDPDPGKSELTASGSDDDDDDYWDDEDEDGSSEEGSGGGDDEHEEVVEVPPGAFTYDKLEESVAQYALSNKTPTERKVARRDAFTSAEQSPFAPPRLKLGNILIALYEARDPQSRAALIDVFRRGTMKWGVWKAIKAIYKLAEARHDAAMFGVIAYRFDAMSNTEYKSGEIKLGTLIYLRRRAWRYLRLLGNASADSYPAFAVEVLRHYPAGHRGSTWVAGHIFNHAQMKWYRAGTSFSLPNELEKNRGFAAAWKLSPAPLLRLLEAADNEVVCDFAIQSLRIDHALALRAVEPAWLARLGRREIAAIHGFVVSLLRESPELHQSKLRGLGLHDVVLAFLRSPSSDARAYALEYAAAHAPDIAVDDLVALVTGGESDVAKFAAARLEALPPQQLGLVRLLNLLGEDAAPWAPAKLAQGFQPREVDARMFVDVAAHGSDPFNQLIKFYSDARVTIPASHWTGLLDDERFVSASWHLRSIVTTAFTELGKRSAGEIGIAWIQKSFEDRNRTDTVARWLDAGMLAGNDLDVEWLKTLVGKPRLRPIALRVLGDRRRVAPARVGLSWLLELARSSDADLAQFAQRMLLESFEPADFANGDAAAGVQRLWELATGKKSPETVRTFAATYLKAHHPELGKRLPEAKALGITPRLGPEAYAKGIVVPLLDDDRADVRRLAVAITGEEYIRWDDQDLVYQLAGSPRSEPRALGGELLLGLLVDLTSAPLRGAARPGKAGPFEGDARRIPAAWLDGRRLFQLAESPHKASREVALTLIRRMYDRVGGAERLAWLMDSTERDVRLFAVRLFWDRHRPKPWPADYVPRKQVGAAVGTERFADIPALRQFARVVLFGLPPGRVGERDPLIEGAPKPERALPASIAKRRLIEAMRDVALDDLEFAKAIMPVLGEFAESTAKGEWQASVQALTALRARHKEAV